MSGKANHEIEFIGEKTIPIHKGQTILEAALAAGLPHFHACGGNAECSTCRVMVVEGIEGLSPVNALEENLRKSVPFPPKIRLACQTCVEKSPVRIRRIIVEKADLSFSVKKQIADANYKLGEKRELVLFFLDIRNFTPFVETYLPFDVIHVIRACYIIFSDIITKHRGEIIDTAGDGFYAVFGLHDNVSAAADAAIRAGKAILTEMDRFNDTYLDPYFGARFQVGIGVHSGQVIVGDVQIGKKSHLSVMGLAVNVAARIQNATKRLNNNFVASQDVLALSTLPNDGEDRVVKLRGVNSVVSVRLIGTAYNIVSKELAETKKRT